MKSENKYIGDDKFENMLDHYKCELPVSVVKMRFAGAVCSPNLELRPTDVIASLWPDGQSPRLETKGEADLFFKYFMGLWDEIFETVKENNIKLSKVKTNNKENLIHACRLRFLEIELGFNEGFWGGKDDFKMPAFIAEMLDSLNELASVYTVLVKKLDKNENLDEIVQTFIYTDKMVDKAINFIVENYVLPRIEDLKRSMN